MKVRDMDPATLECAWCGGDATLDGARPCFNRNGEAFCSRSHRQQSNAALRRFLDSDSAEEAP